MNNQKKFYSHLIEYETIFIELDDMDLSDSEKHHLAQLLDSNLHQTILDAILSELSDEDKEIFIEHLKTQSHDKVWEHLNSKIDHVEEKIKSVAEGLKNDLHKDLEEGKKLKGKS